MRMAPLPPPPHKISNNILIYLTSYRILAPHPLSLPLRSLISIVASGDGGAPKSYKGKWRPPLCH